MADEQYTNETSEEPTEAAAGAPEQAEAPAGAEDSTQAEPASRLAPKERRRKARSTHAGEARPARSPEERHAERVAERKAKAARRRTRRLQERAKRTAARASGAVSTPEPLAPVHAQTEGVRKVRQGVVVSDKADKTIVVKVDVTKLHPRYKKVVRRSVKFHAHDETNQAGIGDTVRIVETRPLSKTKCWRLAEIVEKAK